MRSYLYSVHSKVLSAPAIFEADKNGNKVLPTKNRPQYASNICYSLFEIPFVPQHFDVNIRRIKANNLIRFFAFIITTANTITVFYFF